MEIVPAPSSSSLSSSLLVDDNDDVDGSSSSSCCTKQLGKSVPNAKSPILYSLLCYKNHGKSCTEAFYQKKVSQALALESKNRKDQTMSMLNRFHEKSENKNVDDDDVADDASSVQEDGIMKIA